MKVTFCGHRDVDDSEKVKSWLEVEIKKLISEGKVEFLLGGLGRFDILAAQVVRSLKNEYPDILSVYVAAYINSECNKDLYDCSEFPPIENVPARFAIVHRNRWMINEADVILAYVENTFGGASKTLEYAKRKNKKIINFYNKLTD